MYYVKKKKNISVYTLFSGDFDCQFAIDGSSLEPGLACLMERMTKLATNK